MPALQGLHRTKIAATDICYKDSSNGSVGVRKRSAQAVWWRSVQVTFLADDEYMTGTAFLAVTYHVTGTWLINLLAAFFNDG